MDGPLIVLVLVRLNRSILLTNSPRKQF